MFALSNTLFIIHPIILYLSITKIIFNPLKTNLYLFFFSALFLGGFWSMQELNWGGWWNWDVLETNILFLFIFCLFWTHFKFFSLKKKKRTFKFFFVFLILCSYFLNKTGIGLSIHSFIPAKFLKNYYYFVVFFFCFIFFFWNLKFLSKIAFFWAITFIYFFFIDLKFFKKLIIIFFFMTNSTRLNWLLYNFHQKIKIGVILIILFNLHNKIFFLKNNGFCFYINYFNNFKKNKVYYDCNQINLYNNKNLFLKKPKNIFKLYWEIKLNKNNNYKFTTYIYLK